MPSALRAVRTTDSAAWIDSCITSPSLPVVMVLPLPGIVDRLDRQQLAADLGPREAGHLADLVLLLGHAEGVLAHAEVLVEVLAASTVMRFALPVLASSVRMRLDHLAADLGDLALEAAHAGLARVVAHDVAQRRLR